MRKRNNVHTLIMRHFFLQVEQIADPVEPAAEVVKRCEQKLLMELYKVGTFTDAQDLLRKIAVARGKLKPGGIPIMEVRPNCDQSGASCHGARLSHYAAPAAGGPYPVRFLRLPACCVLE